MKPRIEQLTPKKLIGKRIIMSLAENKTFDLWKNFMPHRKEITNNLNSELVSMKVYHEPLRLADMHQEFDKRAAIEVTDFDKIPNDMQGFDLVGGLYAVFDYKGLNTDVSIFIYIFKTWLPNSEYMLDERPHFEILGEKYKNNDADSEEEIWIPIKLKSS